MLLGFGTKLGLLLIDTGRKADTLPPVHSSSEDAIKKVLLGETTTARMMIDYFLNFPANAFSPYIQIRIETQRNRPQNFRRVQEKDRCRSLFDLESTGDAF